MMTSTVASNNAEDTVPTALERSTHAIATKRDIDRHPAVWLVISSFYAIPPRPLSICAR